MFMPINKTLSIETVRNILLYQKEILSTELLILPLLEKYKV